MSLCESKISTDHLVLKEPCKAEFSFTVYRQSKVMLANFPIIITTTYRVNIEPIGFALGRHLYSLPLTPGEEVEIEIFRSAKVERELSQQYSTEVEFTEEFAHTCRYEWSKERESNWEVGGGAGFGIDLGIFDFESQGSAGYSETEREFQRVVGEVMLKTKLRVDRKFDMHVGLKTEVENRYRSTRKIKNPNVCRSLTYNYFQLMRKFRITMTRTGLRFDYPRVIKGIPSYPRVLADRIPAVIRSYTMPPPELKTLVATREEKSQSVGSSNPGSTAATTASAKRLVAVAVAPALAPEFSTHPAVKTLLHPIAEEPRALELTPERLLAKMDGEKAFDIAAERKKTTTAAERRRLQVAINLLRKKFPIGKISEREVCINTNSMHVEPMMGLCLACEEHMLELRKLELEKAKVELEKAKQEIEG